MLLTSDDSGNIDEVSSHKRNRGRWQRRPTAWTEAMARQLLSPPSHPEMLGRIGRYEVERLIGTSGTGGVFKAFDSEFNRPVAVKLLTPYLEGSGAARKRFAREARAAAAVVHEHVVAIHNVETDGEVPFLVMQYVPGESLQSRLDREGALDICEILRIGMQTLAYSGWKDRNGWPVERLTMHNTPVKPDVGVRLVQLIRTTTGHGHTRVEGDAGLLEEKVTGDFVVRADADPAKV